MRVTDRMLYDRAAADGGLARARMDEATARVSSGAKVVHPGDDPAAAGLVAMERSRVQRLEAIATTAGRASDELAAADGALDTVSSALSRARELAVQLSSSPYSAAERTGAAEEVKGLIQTVVASLNVKVGNRYVFGGSVDDTAPFGGIVLDAANPIAGSLDPALTGAYAGDAAVRQVELAPGVLQDASVRADVAVKGASGGVDVLATLAGLANALLANDPAAVAAALDPLAQGTTQVANARGAGGAAMAALDTAVSANRAARDDAKKRISGLADADPVQSMSDLALAQHALEASLTATAQSFRFTLLDKLR
jgi:flagellar hook-associated protein 3 FlgL